MMPFAIASLVLAIAAAVACVALAVVQGMLRAHLPDDDDLPPEWRRRR